MLHKIMNKIKAKGKYRILVYKAGTDELLKTTDWISNLIVLNTNSGLNLVAKHLIGDDTYSLEITKAKMGDDDTAPADADTDLGNTVVNDILWASREESSVGVVLFQFFVADSEMPDQDYKEFGIFCGDRLFARSIITPTFTKSSGQDIRVEYQITLTNS